MQLAVRDAAKICGVSVKTIYQWIREKGLPARSVQKQYRLNQSELLEWATSHGIKIADPSFGSRENLPAEASLAKSLEAGGVFYGIQARDKAAALDQVIHLIRLPQNVNRETLAKFVRAREAMASTGIGEGIAIPHPRNPIVLHVPYPVIGLCFLSEPVDFDAIDGRKVDTLFMIVTPNVRIHLQILARLSFALRDASFRTMLAGKRPVREILDVAKKFDAVAVAPKGGG